MAIYNPTTPPLFLTGTVSSVQGKDQYSYIDETQISFTGAYYTYTITVSSIAYQTIGTAETRSGASKQYNGLDVKAGDWVTSANGQIVLNIISVIEKDDTSITFVAKDIDMISYKTYANNALSNGDSLAFFEVSDSRTPLITGPDVQAFFNTPLAIDKIQGRFAAETESERYRFEFTTPQTGYDIGDIITVSEIDGSFVKYGTENSSAVPVGVVIEKIINNTVIYIKPFNTIVDNHTAPELLTGSVGNIYYAHPSNPGAMATTQYPGALPLFLQIRDAIPTVIEATQSNYLPTSNDVVIINNVTVFDNAIHIVPADISAFKTLINGGTSTHKVAATSIAEYASVSSTASATGMGVSLIVVSSDGGATYNGLTTTFSDGTNSVTVNFDENQGVQLIPYPTAPTYLTYSASLIATVLNTEFQNAGLNLEASASLPGDGQSPTVYGILTIEATDPNASIQITGTDTDGFGNTFTSGMGIAGSTPASSAEYLILTRADGGDILISGQGSYINNNGITSSSIGEAPVLLMLEGANKEQETGVSVGVDKNQVVATATTHDHFVTGIDIDYTPFSDSEVIVKINGVEVNIGDGDNSEDCYFTDPTDPGYNTDGNAMVAKPMADIAAGDVLVWNPSAAGYQLDPSDDVDVIYDASSYDV